jgi:hypothetical protein
MAESGGGGDGSSSQGYHLLLVFIRAAHNPTQFRLQLIVYWRSAKKCSHNE